MPIYVYRCPACGSDEDAFRHINERDDAPEHCGISMERIITPTMIQVDIPAYQSPIDGREVRGRKARMEDLKRNGCRPWEGMEAEKAHAQSRVASEEAKEDKEMEASLHEIFNHMDAHKQDIVRKGERS